MLLLAAQASAAVALLFVASHKSVIVINAGERGVKAVVVALRNGIELVIMTTVAADGQPEKSFTGCADHFVDRNPARIWAACTAS